MLGFSGLLLPTLAFLAGSATPRAAAAASSVLRVSTPPLAVLAETKPLAVLADKRSSALKALSEGRLYSAREAPKIAGGVKIGTRRLVVITGASSGLGLSATKALVDQGYFVIAAVRNPTKMDEVAKENGIKKSSYVAMRLELACASVA